MTSSQMHKYLAFLWALLALPTVLWWHDSILWISLVSLYANGVGHWSAFQASKAEEKVDEECHDTDKPPPTPNQPHLPRYNTISSPPEAPTSPPGPQNDLIPCLPFLVPPKASKHN